ncbi:DUF371 domain-containing protein [Candidatus Woesearchaeota archaeon]|nr:DUF371 domain-containing protein [Candidatus Woesearchaeota archaeon]
MSYSFSAYGRKNITAKHKTTLEFTKDKEVTKKGDCIVGAKADFDLKSIKKFIKNKKKIRIKIKAGDFCEEIRCEVNPNFGDSKEIVIRKSDFISKRTLGINANKAAADLNKKIIELLKNPNQKLLISLS